MSYCLKTENCCLKISTKHPNLSSSSSFSFSVNFFFSSLIMFFPLFPFFFSPPPFNFSYAIIIRNGPSKWTTSLVRCGWVQMSTRSSSLSEVGMTLVQSSMMLSLVWLKLGEHMLPMAMNMMPLNKGKVLSLSLSLSLSPPLIWRLRFLTLYLDVEKMLEENYFTYFIFLFVIWVVRTPKQHNFGLNKVES